MNDLELDRLGGIVPETSAEMRRAKAVDLVTLPKSILGTNCSNCEYIDLIGLINGKTSYGYCRHREVAQIVTAKNCCALWDQKQAIRAWEKK